MLDREIELLDTDLRLRESLVGLDQRRRICTAFLHSQIEGPLKGNTGFCGRAREQLKFAEFQR